MNKLSKNKEFVLYYVLVLIILWVLVYACFAFVLAELNPFKWEQSTRGGYVFAILSILGLGVGTFIPIFEIIKHRS